MFVSKVRKVVNPHKRRKVKRVARAANGRFLKKTKRRAKKTSRRSNPAHLLTLGFVNPHRPHKRKVHRKRNKGMATTKRRKSAKRSAAAKKAARTRKRNLMAKSNPVKRRRRRHVSVARRNPARRKHYARRRRNGTRVIVMAPKRRNGRRSRRNPTLFGQHLSVGQAAKVVASGLVGVTATKLVVPMIPGGLTSTPIGAAIASIIVALGGGWLIGKWDSSMGSGFAFGGLMQAGSILLNMIPVPGVSQFALSGYGRGVGDFVPASFPIPQNPILQPAGGAIGRGGAAQTGAYPSAYRR